MRTLDLPPGKSPREWGRIHGESFRSEIKALSEIRTYLCTRVGTFSDHAQVMAAAKAHLPILERYCKPLYDEVLGIAEGAIVSPEDIVVANHYTDLRDLDPDPQTWRMAGTADDPAAGMAATGSGGRGGDGCSMFFLQTQVGRILAQTWDMHATAIPYVMVLGIPENEDGPAARLLTVTGCLGMAGMNAAGVGVAINNLYSTDATLGIVWPAMVRHALHETTAAAARDVIMSSPIGSGHHYFVADSRDAYSIETSGRRRKLVWQSDDSHVAQHAYCHTNHCLDGDIESRSKLPAATTTHERLKHVTVGIGGVEDLEGAWRLLGSDEGWPKSICTNMATAENPHGAATCGAVAMNLTTGEWWAQQGFVHNVAPEKWQL
jgi:isopenicillin-N N-acyltransferase like protein